MSLLRPIISVGRCERALTSSLCKRLAHESTMPPLAYKFETLTVTSPVKHVLQVELNRPQKLNAMNRKFWEELPRCFEEISDDKNCRAVVLSAAGRMYTAGLDFADVGQLMTQGSSDGEGEADVARKAHNLRRLITDFQHTFTAIEKCPKPVIAAVHNGCIGGGVNMIAACDIRYCTEDAYFQVKEVDLGLAADVGVLQRVPKLMGNRSLVSELVFTARRMEAAEAKQEGLVSRVFPDRDQLLNAALEVAQQIASKSPVAVQGSKVNLLYARDHSVEEALRFMACWNMCMLQSEDLVKAAVAVMTKQKEPPAFSNL